MLRLFERINKNIANSLSLLFQKNNHSQDLPIITLSREMGSGGRPIAYLVAKKLGPLWEVYHQKIIAQIQEETNLEEELVRQVDEDNIPLIQQLIDNAMGKKFLNLSGYYKHLVKVLSTIGQRGHAIIIGRGANFLLPNALKIRVVCEMEQRIRWIMKYERVPQKEALRRIQESDEKRTCFTKSLFSHDPRKAHHYDMVIRTGKTLSIEDAADIIVCLTQKRFNI